MNNRVIGQKNQLECSNGTFRVNVGVLIGKTTGLLDWFVTLFSISVDTKAYIFIIYTKNNRVYVYM